VFRSRLKPRVVLRYVFGASGAALLVFLVVHAGARALLDNAKLIGWGLAIVIALGGLSHLIKAWAWRLTLPREAHCPLCCSQCHLGRAFLRIEDEAIDDDVGVFAERKRATVVEGNLQARVRSGAKTVIHMHWRAHNRSLCANLRLVLNSGHSANDAFGASTQAGTKKK